MIKRIPGSSGLEQQEVRANLDFTRWCCCQQDSHAQKIEEMGPFTLTPVFGANPVLPQSMFDEFAYQTTDAAIHLETADEEVTAAAAAPDADPVVFGATGHNEQDDSNSVVSEKDDAARCGSCIGGGGPCLVKPDVANIKEQHTPLDDEEMSEASLVDNAWWCIYCCCAGCGCLEAPRTPNITCDFCFCCGGCEFIAEPVECMDPTACLAIDSCCCCTQVCQWPLIEGFPRCIFCTQDFCGLVGGYEFALHNRENLETVDRNKLLKLFDRAIEEELVLCYSGFCCGCGLALQRNCQVRSQSKCFGLLCSLMSADNGCGMLCQLWSKLCQCRVPPDPCFCSCWGRKCCAGEEPSGIDDPLEDIVN